jgi:hypothetical protein
MTISSSRGERERRRLTPLPSCPCTGDEDVGGSPAPSKEEDGKDKLELGSSPWKARGIDGGLDRAFGFGLGVEVLMEGGNDGGRYDCVMQKGGRGGLVIDGGDVKMINMGIERDRDL